VNVHQLCTPNRSLRWWLLLAAELSPRTESCLGHRERCRREKTNAAFCFPFSPDDDALETCKFLLKSFSKTIIGKVGRSRGHTDLVLRRWLNILNRRAATIVFMMHSKRPPNSTNSPAFSRFSRRNHRSKHHHHVLTTSTGTGMADHRLTSSSYSTVL